jgi:hypothetical protein
MVRRFLTVHRRDRRLRSDVLRALAENRLGDVERMGAALAEIFENALSLFEAVRQCLPIAGRFGSVAAADRFERAGEDYRRWAEELRRSWPWVDHTRLQRSFDSSEEGRVRPTKELLDELHDSAHP